MNLHNIFHGLNLRGNKIVNARVDTPTENTHIPNKIYVDTASTYDTTKATQFPTSPKFSWMNALSGKTIKEILDMLFFPVIAPTYTNPILTEATIKFPENQLLDNGFYQLFSGQTVPFSIKCSLSVSDRLSDQIIRVVARYEDTSELSFYGTTTNGIDTITGDMPIKSGMTISVERLYEESAIIKNDNYGNPSIPEPFTIPLNFVEDITSKIFNESNLSESPLVAPFDVALDTILIENAELLFDDLNATYGFTKNHMVNLLSSGSSYYWILIPKELYDRSNILIAYDGIQENLLKSWLYSATITVNGIEYVACKINFGVFKTSSVAKLIFTDNS